MRMLTTVNSPENAPELLRNDVTAYMMMEADSAEGTSSASDAVSPPAESGHPTATRYATHRTNVRRLIISPTANVLST